MRALGGSILEGTRVHGTVNLPNPMHFSHHTHTYTHTHTTLLSPHQHTIKVLTTLTETHINRHAAMKLTRRYQSLTQTQTHTATHDTTHLWTNVDGSRHTLTQTQTQSTHLHADPAQPVCKSASRRNKSRGTECPGAPW